MTRFQYEPSRVAVRRANGRWPPSSSGTKSEPSRSRFEARATADRSAASIETASARQTDYKSYAETLSSDLTSVDVAAVTAELSTYESQLTASYSALGKILSLNLASYLK